MATLNATPAPTVTPPPNSPRRWSGWSIFLVVFLLMLAGFLVFRRLDHALGYRLTALDYHYLGGPSIPTTSLVSATGGTAVVDLAPLLTATERAKAEILLAIANLPSGVREVPSSTSAKDTSVPELIECPDPDASRTNPSKLSVCQRVWEERAKEAARAVKFLSALRGAYKNKIASGSLY